MILPSSDTTPLELSLKLSNPQLNHNSTQHNITVGLNMKMTLPTTHRNSVLAMSQLLLTWFWWNFKFRFLETSRTDSNCHSGICPDNICPGDICPYQEYLSCYWVWAVPSSGNSYDWFDFHFWRADYPILVCQSYLFTKDNLQWKTALVYESLF